MTPRPPFIRHTSELPSSIGKYSHSEEGFSNGTPLSRPLGLSRIGVHHERLEPGHRTSLPHAESLEEELIYVLEGTPDAWVNGELHRLAPGDVVVFPPGTGIAHTFINDTDTDVRLLVVGDNLEANRIDYPLDPDRMAVVPPVQRWADVPKHPLGPHDGKPKRRA